MTTDTDPVAATSAAEPNDWKLAEKYLHDHPTRLGRSLNWIAFRPLLESINDRFDGWSGGLVDDLRRAWVPQPPEPVEYPDATRFMIIGDTGEQDGSQYVVAPALSRAVRGQPGDPETAFVLMMSDIIYPAGAVDDYVDGVYKPYRSNDPNFRVDVPLLAIPGNHDWYDSLAGFMFNFCRKDRLPPEAYARAGLGPIARLFRILWRRPFKPGSAVRAARDTIGVGPTQPAPYFAIKTKHLIVVAIDAGIDGTVDQDQWAWLQEVSRLPGPKILVTGNPLVVNARVEPCWVGKAPKDSFTAKVPSLWKDLVGNPAYNYIATVGGDVHNYQRYPAAPHEGPGPRVNIVSGGGGAFMHATHSYALAANDSRLIENPHVQPYRQPDESYPTPAQSLDHFARLLIPSMRRTVRNLGLCLAGVLAVSIGALVEGDASRWASYAGWFAIVALTALGLIRLARSKDERDTALPRALAAVGGFFVGALAAVIAYRLDPGQYFLYLIVWLVATAYHVALNMGVRRTGWWRPANQFFKPVGGLAFGAGLFAMSVLAFGLQVWLNGLNWQPIASSSLLLVVGIVGWRLRGKPTDGPMPSHYRWYRWGATVGALVQAVFFVFVLHQLAHRAGRRWVFDAGWEGLLAFLGILAAAAIALLLLTELITLVGWKPYGGRVSAWGHAAVIMHHASVPLVLAAVVGWWLIARAIGAEPSAGLPVTLIVPFALLIEIAGLRRLLPRGYLFLVVPLLIIGGFAAYATWTEPVQIALGAAAVLFATGLTAILGHLAFLAVYKIWTTPGANQPPKITESDYELILAERTDWASYPQPELAENVRQWARLTAPSLGEPGGPLQRGIAEIYSVDRPPFFKGFLQVDATETTVQIVLHRVNGVERLPPHEVATITLRPEGPAPT
jgi:hypothetical protein